MVEITDSMYLLCVIGLGRCCNNGKGKGLMFYNKCYKESMVKLFNLLFKLFSMKKNMGNTDRIIRLLLAAVVAVLYFTNTITGTLGIVLLVLAGVFVLTSLISFCPLYTLLGLNTCPAKKV